METSLFSPDKLHIKEFKIIKGEIDSPFEVEAADIEGHSFEVAFEMSFNNKLDLVKADFSVSVISKSQNENAVNAKGSFEFVFIFEVDNLSELTTIDKKAKSIDVDPNLANAIAAITYSTARGILLTRFQGTALADFILPIMDPNKLIKQG